MSALTVTEKVSIAKISQLLATLDILKSGYEGGGQDLTLPRKLYMIRKNVEWLYNIDPTNETLTATSNYLYALCDKYTFKAQKILNTGSGGGTIAPVVFNSRLEPYDWQVGGATSDSQPLKAGDSSVTLTRFIRCNIEFSVDDLVQNTTPPSDGISIYYSWNPVTALFTLLNGVAQLGQRMRILPVSSILSTNSSGETINQTEFTSGLLEVGQDYEIIDYEGGDDFTNVATVLTGIINTNGCTFTCIGTTPTNWSNSSVLRIIN